MEALLRAAQQPPCCKRGVLGNPVKCQNFISNKKEFVLKALAGVFVNQAHYRNPLKKHTHKGNIKFMVEIL